MDTMIETPTDEMWVVAAHVLRFFAERRERIALVPDPLAHVDTLRGIAHSDGLAPHELLALLTECSPERTQP